MRNHTAVRFSDFDSNGLPPKQELCGATQGPRKSKPHDFNGRGPKLLAWTAMCLASLAVVPSIQGEIVEFFNPQLVATPVESGPTWDSISCQGYLFTYTRDKLFTGGGSTPIGRPVRVNWPTGIEAQAVTTGPNPGKAKVTIERLDGEVFDFTSFSAKLLANTFGAGGSFEVVPFLNGEEVFNDPIVFDASGFYGQVFSYDGSPNPWGSTALLRDFDKYSIDLYVDFALVALQFDGPVVVPEPPIFAAFGVSVALVVTLIRRPKAARIED